MKRSIQALLIVFFMLLLTTISEAGAHELVAESDKAVYRPGDTITIWAEVTNTKNEAVDLAVEAVLRDLRSKSPPHPFLYRLSLSPNETRRVELFELLVDESFYSGTYVVHVSLIEGRFRVYEEEIYFEVEGAPEDMEVEILLCTDSACTEQTRIFIKNEKIYMRLNCSVEKASFAADLTLPDNSSRPLTLPTDVTAKQAGAYTLRVRASAEGYRDVTLTEYFAVLEKEPGVLQAEKKPSSISLSVSTEEVTEGETLEAYGAITPPHADVIVTLTHKKDGETHGTRTVVTDDDGRYLDIFKPESSGEWSITAGWEGDSNHEGSESDEVSLNVTAAAIPVSLLVGIAVVVVCGAVLALILRRRR